MSTLLIFAILGAILYIAFLNTKVESEQRHNKMLQERIDELEGDDDSDFDSDDGFGDD